MSEAFLPDADRATENMLKILRQAGSDLVLTEPSLDEVWTHLISTDTEFAADWAAIEPKVDLALASQAQRILIRSYFYATLAPKSHRPRFKGWSSYIDQFCPYKSLRKAEGKDGLCARLHWRAAEDHSGADHARSVCGVRDFCAERADRLAIFWGVRVHGRCSSLHVCWPNLKCAQRVKSCH